MLSWGDLLYTSWIYSLDQGLNLWARSLICRLRGFAALLSLLFKLYCTCITGNIMFLSYGYTKCATRKNIDCQFLSLVILLFLLSWHCVLLFTNEYIGRHQVLAGIPWCIIYLVSWSRDMLERQKCGYMFNEGLRIATFIYFCCHLISLNWY